jgi:hypothetical protein
MMFLFDQAIREHGSLKAAMQAAAAARRKPARRPGTLAGHEGERLKADALALLESRREVYVLRGRRALLEALLRSNTATVDEVRQAVELPAGINPKLFGIVPGPLARAGIIRQAGFAKTCRPEGHARPVTIWALADRAAAERWLRGHPDLPAPDDDDQGQAVQGVLFPTQPTNEPGATAATVTPGME